MRVNKRKIEIAMARAELNRDEMAKKANMPVSTISNIYKRETCKPATIGRITKVLGVDVIELLED